MSDDFDIDRAALLRTFVAEGVELLAAMEAGLLSLESNPRDEARLRELFRLAHTVKGNASLLGFDQVVELAHASEDALHRLTLPVDGSAVSRLLAAVDGLRLLFRHAAEDEQVGADVLASLLARLTATSDAAAPADVQEQRETTIRIDLERLDRMLEMIGEVAVARARARMHLEDGDVARLRDDWEELESPLAELEQLVSRARTVPVGPSFRPYARMVRELAQSNGKRARLVVDGEDVEVDARVIEQLRDPLTHMVRNAIDHGLESPEKRAAAGKDPLGVLKLSARREGGHLSLILSDDGAGIDKQKLIARAVERGFTDAPTWDERRLFRLLFESGFSTASQVTELSGRGVGLDVVLRHVQSLRGEVEISSEPGRGTAFHLRVPITVALLSCFAVDAAGETFLLPSDTVRECVELPGGAPRSTGLLNLRGEPLAWVRLSELFDLPGGEAGRSSVVIVEHGQKRAGLVVDRLLGEQQTMVKPLARLFRRADGVAGSAVMGTGRVALVLDVASVVRRASETSAGGR
jgi:two-component system chemotaxis sensor kinase CheA